MFCSQNPNEMDKGPKIQNNEFVENRLEIELQ